MTSNDCNTIWKVNEVNNCCCSSACDQTEHIREFLCLSILVLFCPRMSIPRVLSASCGVDLSAGFWTWHFLHLRGIRMINWQSCCKMKSRQNKHQAVEKCRQAGANPMSLHILTCCEMFTTMDATRPIYVVNWHQTACTCMERLGHSITVSWEFREFQPLPSVDSFWRIKMHTTIWFSVLGLLRMITHKSEHHGAPLTRAVAIWRALQEGETLWEPVRPIFTPFGIWSIIFGHSFKLECWFKDFSSFSWLMAILHLYLLAKSFLVPLWNLIQ